MMERYIRTLPKETQRWLQNFSHEDKLRLIAPFRYEWPLTFEAIQDHSEEWTPDPDTGLRFSVEELDAIKSYPLEDQVFVANHHFVDGKPWCFGSCYYRTCDHPRMRYSPDYPD